MDNQLIPYSQVTTEIVENASRFTEFLSSETVSPIRPTITVIPNIIKDILNVTLEHKQLKIQDRQFRRKAELAKQYLDLQDRDSQRRYRVELEKVRAHSESVIAEVAQRRDVGLAQIESEKQMQLQKIKSDERVKIAEIKTQYELGRQRQKSEKEMFQKALHESNRRFDWQMKNAEKVQSEFSQLIKVIMDNMVKGIASDYEYKLLEHLSSLKIQALEKSFDISEGFLNMFSEGE